MLLNSPAADIFHNLVRMNDGPMHRPVKQAVSAVFADIDKAHISQCSSDWAKVLFGTLKPLYNPAILTDFGFHLPVYVMGDLLGIPSEHLYQVSEWIRDFVSCLSPISAPDQIERGKVASGHLLNVFHRLLATEDVQLAGGLLGQFSAEAVRENHISSETVIVNAIGFLSQAYEATAGLISNTLVYSGP